MFFTFLFVFFEIGDWNWVRLFFCFFFYLAFSIIGTLTHFPVKLWAFVVEYFCAC